MNKRRAPASSRTGKRAKGSTHSSSQIIEDDNICMDPPKPQDVRYTHIISSVHNSSARSYTTTFSKAPASPVKKKVVLPEDYAAFNFSGVSFGGITEPPVLEHQFTSFGAAFSAEFPTEIKEKEEKEKKKCVRNLEVRASAEQCEITS